MRRLLLCVAIAVSVCPVTTPQSDAAFPGSNGLIAYSDGSSGSEGLWALDPATKHRHQLTSDFADGGPAFSPDGAWIAFSHQGVLSLIRPDGSHQHVIARRKNIAGGPAWSPDGRRIVYTYGGDPPRSVGTLRVMRKDGTHDHSLNIEGGCAAWSPDGEWLTASVHHSGGSRISHIFRVRPDGTHQQRLTTYRGDAAVSDGLGETCADWSPDGRHLVYVRSWSDTADQLHFGVFVMRPDGSHDHRITRLWSGQVNLYDATYSPDGQRVAYVRGGHLYTIDADGGHRHLLTAPDDDAQPSLSWQSI